MINILEVIPNSHDASSFYRGRMPLTQLRKQKQSIDTFPMSTINQTLDWDFLTMFDIAFLQRPVAPATMSLIKDLKKFQIPIVIDYDDDYFNIPLDHPAYKTAGAGIRNNMVKSILPQADAIFVSTERLKEIYTPYTQEDKIHVVPNALCETVFTEEPKAGIHKFIVWRGSSSHSKDITKFGEAILRCSQSDWLFNFYGENPWHITEQLDNRYNYFEYTNIVDYMLHLKALSPKVVIVPLEDTPFNKARAHSAWLEATYAGAILLAPNWPNWELPGTVHYDSISDFEYKLKQIMEFDQSEFDSRFQLAKEELPKHYLCLANKKREEVFKNLMKKV